MPRQSAREKPTAATADPHVLYQESVQDPEGDAAFFSRFFKRYTGAELRSFREDFCGTAVLSCHFIKRHRDNRALGVDLSARTLAWGRRHNVRKLLDSEQQQRLRLVRADVRTVRRPQVQLTAALNFSYSVFHARSELAEYVTSAYAALQPGGVLMLDAWGGSEAMEIESERRRLKGFTYVWDQHDFDPVTHRIDCRIHFEFRDGTRLRNAFRYDWRLWTLPELRELFAGAGFDDVHVLWEGTDSRTWSGNGVFRRVQRGEVCPAWIAYVVGRKQR
jgi:SAM-dependent methyltransferase